MESEDNSYDNPDDYIDEYQEGDYADGGGREES